jgi:protein-S-isoprenylcysteine O-methyltransferase Ste14
MSRNIALLRWTVSCLALAGLMLACAGSVDLPMMWIYLGVSWGLGLPAALIADVSLDVERRQPGPGAIDPASRPAASFLFLATLMIAALDAGRFHRSDPIPREVQFAGLVAFMATAAIQSWAITANPFFSAAIRIQPERGHRLVTGGPYRFIRHPGYLAMAISMPATALALGSLIAVVPALFYSVLILCRVRREDQFLQQNLQDYSEYAEAVRCRLIPGLW